MFAWGVSLVELHIKGFVGGTSAGVSGRGAGTYLSPIKACNAAGCGPYLGNASTRVIFAPAG